MTRPNRVGDGPSLRRHAARQHFEQHAPERKGISDLPGDRERIRNGERSIAHPIRQRVAFDELEDQGADPPLSSRPWIVPMCG